MIVDVVTFGLTVDGMAISAHATLITLLYLHDQCIGVIVWIRFRQGDLLAVMLLIAIAFIVYWVVAWTHEHALSRLEMNC